MEVENIKLIGFDWDGTLADSMTGKAKYFVDAINEFYPDAEKHRKEIEISFLHNGGKLRKIQLEIIQERYGLNPLSDEKYEKWSELFTSLYIDKKLPLFDDTIRVLNELKKREYMLVLCSSVPQEHLDRTMEMYSVKKYFEFILGTRDAGKFRKGIPHLSFISEKTGIPIEQMAFVGDGAPDIEGANEAGAFSVGKADTRVPGSREMLEEKKPKLVIEKLEELLEYFK